MHPNETRLLQRLRSPELAHSLRGFDEGETRHLLEQAAAALEGVYKDRDRAREEAHVAGARAKETPDAEAIGRALLTATSAGEQIVSAAREQAQDLIAEATAEAERMSEQRRAAGEELEQARAGLARERDDMLRELEADRQEMLMHARAEAERLVAEARSEVERLRSEAEEVAAFLETKRAAFVEMASDALERLERIESGAPDTETAETLVADLHPGGSGS